MFFLITTNQVRHYAGHTLLLKIEWQCYQDSGAAFILEWFLLGCISVKRSHASELLNNSLSL